MKRFYANATTADAGDNRWQILLDEKVMKTPEGEAFCLPCPKLAAAVADEWQNQPEEFDPKQLMLTRFAGSAVAVSDEESAARRAEMLGYADTDLLCYYGEDAALQAMQREQWQPVLEKLRAHYGIELLETQGIMPLSQPEASKQKLAEALETYEVMRLSALWHLTMGLGSLYLALAVAELELDGEAAIAASQLEELFQAQKWGEDEEAAQARAAKAEHIRSILHFLQFT
jgi:chaperone required for assembly of F1-ATPase